MPKFLVAAAIVLVPLTAFAQEAPPPSPSPAPIQGPLVEINIAAPGVAPVVTPVVTPAPIVVAPAVAPTPAPAPSPEGEHCAWKSSAATQHRRGRLSFGIAKGHVELEDEREGKQFSFIARATGRRGFGVELEFSRINLGDEDKARTGGGALFKAFGKRKLAPYVIAGAGGGVIEGANGSEQRMRYAEAGGGLMVRGRRLAIGVDFRRGSRRLDTEATGATAEPMDTASATITPDDEDRQRYVRGRIMALIQF